MKFLKIALLSTLLIISSKQELSNKFCGSLMIVGCETCHSDTEKGCSLCQSGAGIELKEGVSTCIECPDQNCDRCELTEQGRQCQRCKAGFKYNNKDQVCFRGHFSFGIIVIGFLSFFFYC